MSNLLSRKKVAERLSVSVDTIKRWEKAGKITWTKTPGGGVRFKEEWIESILNKRTVKNKS
jgi:excisionase family DNA binding protein